MIKHYILEDGKPKVVPLMEWGRWLEKANRKIALTKIGKVKVSTIFLGLDHGFGGKVILFETMIFGGKHDQWCQRYSTMEEAKNGHDEAVKMIKAGAK